MTTTLNIPQSTVSVNWSFSKTNAWGTPSSNQATYTYSGALAQGSGAGGCKKILVDQATITTGATQSYSLDSFTDMFGQTTQAMTIVRLIYVQGVAGTPAATAGAQVSGTMMQVTSNSGGVIDATTTSGKLEMGPNGVLFMERTDATGWTVTASTGNTFTVKNLDSNTQVFNIAIIGE